MTQSELDLKKQELELRVMEVKVKFIENLASKKFQALIATFLVSLGTGISGLFAGCLPLSAAGGVLAVIGAAVYQVCETSCDRADINSKTETVTTNKTETVTTNKSTVANANGSDGSSLDKVLNVITADSGAQTAAMANQQGSSDAAGSDNKEVAQ